MKNELLSSVKLPEVNSRRGIQTVQAGPVAAVVMALTGTATLGAALGKIVLGLAVNALMRKKRKARGGSTPGIKTDVSTVGGTTPQSFILGRYATGGNHVAPAMSMEQSGSTKNANLVFVMDVADMPVKSITRIMVDGEYVTFNATPDANGFLAAQGRLNGYMWAKFHDGTQTAADPWLISKLGSYPDRPWGADMIGRGIAYAVLMFHYNRERYSGLPSVKFEVDGISLYDPRKDSTVAGGSGPQRWDDPTTWKFTTNPAVMVYNILRGIPLPGGKVYGLGVSADEIPLSHAVAAMNVCDTVPPGRSVAQYRAGYEVKIGSEDDGGEDPLTVIDELLKAMDGDVAEVGGDWYIRAGGPGLPVMTITDGDIVRNKPQDLDPFPGLGETVNGLHASGPDPDALWEAKEAPSRYLADAIAEDGQTLTTSINLPSVFDRIQMQQLMKAWLEDARRFAKHNISLMPHAVNLVPLDVIRWNSERNKYTNKDFEIDQMGISARTLAPTLAIREVDPAAGRWQPGDDLPETTPAPVVVVPAPEAVPGALVDGIAIEDETGHNRRAAIRIRWNPDLPDAQAIMYKVTDKKTGQLVTNGSTNNIEDGEEIVSAGVLPVTVYRVQIRMRANRETIWTNAFEVTTPQVYLQSGEVDPDLIDAIEQAQNTADAAGQAANQALNDAQSANANAAQAATDAAAAHTEAQQAATDANAAAQQAAANAGRIDGVELEQITLDSKIDGVKGEADAIAADLQNNYLTAAQTNSAISQAETSLSAKVAKAVPVYDFVNKGDGWQRSDTGVQSVNSPLADGDVVSVDRGFAAQSVGFQFVNPVRVLKLEPGHTYEFEARVRVTVDSTNTGGNREQVYMGAVILNNSGTIDGYAALSPVDGKVVNKNPLRKADGWVTLKGRYTAPSNPSGKYLRGRLYYGFNNPQPYGNATWQVSYFRAQDVSDAANAEADVRATLTNNYLTRAQTDAAIAISEQALTAEIGTVETNLQNNYYTKAQTNSAITTSENTLTAKIDTAEAMQLVSGFADDGKFWQSYRDGVPFGPGSKGLDGAWTFGYDPNAKAVIARLAPSKINATRWLMQRGAFTPIIGRTYRLRVKISIWGTISGAGPQFSLFFRTLRENYTAAGAAPGFESFNPRTSSWSDYYEITVKCDASNAAPLWRAGLYIRGDDWDTTGGLGVQSVEVEDVTNAIDLGGEIQEIATLDINALSGTALANLLNQLNTNTNGVSATVSSLQQTQTDVNGFASAYAGLTVTTSGGKISGFRANSWSNPAGSGATLELLGDVLVEQSLNANRLTIGLGKNLLDNPDVLQQLAAYQGFTNGTIGSGAVISRRDDGSTYGTQYYPTLRVQLATNAVTTSGYAGISLRPMGDDGSFGVGYPVQGGEWYEFSVATRIRRIRMQLRVYWYKADGTAASRSMDVYNDRNTTSAEGAVNPANWNRYGAVKQAPSDAAYARPQLRVVGITATGNIRDFHAFQPMFAKSVQGAELSPYSPGTTAYFDGGRLIADTVTADKMNVTELSAITAKIGTFKSASSGERVEIEDDRIRVFDSSNTARVIIGKLN